MRKVQFITKQKNVTVSQLSVEVASSEVNEEDEGLPPAAPIKDNANATTVTPSKNTFMAMLTDNNLGKTSTMAVTALVVAVLFLIYTNRNNREHTPMLLAWLSLQIRHHTQCRGNHCENDGYCHIPA